MCFPRKRKGRLRTYIRFMAIDYKDLPSIIVNFLSHKLNIQGRSQLTVDEYAYDLRYFFKYVVAARTNSSLKEADISCVDASFADSVDEDDVYCFLLYLAKDKHAKPTTRSRKLASIRSFYKYHTVKSRLLKNNPAKNVDAPKMPYRLPIAMGYDEALQLLSSLDKKDINYRRDYLIILIFLNCGIRLSELVGINLSDIDSDYQRFTVRGKGDKERALFFNDACREALLEYLLVRQKPTLARGKKVIDTDALFLSRNGVRISKKTVQWIINRQLEVSGLGEKGYSTHKLRHTAATLMYNMGKVDVLLLQQMLGHEQLNTTQIYTHVASDKLKEAMTKSPFNSPAKEMRKRKKFLKEVNYFREPVPDTTFLFSDDEEDEE